MVKRRTVQNAARQARGDRGRRFTRDDDVNDDLASLRTAANEGHADYEAEQGAGELRSLYEQIVPTPEPADIDRWIEQTRDEIALDPDNLSWDHFIKDMRERLGISGEAQEQGVSSDDAGQSSSPQEVSSKSHIRLMLEDGSETLTHDVIEPLARDMSWDDRITDDRRAFQDSHQAWSLEDALRRLADSGTFGKFLVGASIEDVNTILNLARTRGDQLSAAKAALESNSAEEAEASSEAADQETPAAESESDADTKSLDEYAEELAADATRYSALTAFIQSDRQANSSNWSLNDALERAIIDGFVLPDLPAGDLAAIYNQASAVLPTQLAARAASKRAAAPTAEEAAPSVVDTGAKEQAAAAEPTGTAGVANEAVSGGPASEASTTHEQQKPTHDLGELSKGLSIRMSQINHIVKLAEAEWQQRQQTDPATPDFDKDEEFRAAAIASGIPANELTKRQWLRVKADARKIARGQERPHREAEKRVKDMSPEEQRSMLESRRDSDRTQVAEALANMDDATFDGLADDIKAIEALLAATNYADGKPEDIYEKAVQQVLRIRGTGDPEAFIKLDGEYPISLSAAAAILNADSVRRSGKRILPSTPPRTSVAGTSTAAQAHNTSSVATGDQAGAPATEPGSPDDPTITPPIEADPTVPPALPEDPTDTPEARRQLVAAFVDETHDARIDARDAAEARLRDELQQGGIVRRFIKNIWKGEHGLARAYYLDKYKREALAKNEHENDALANQSNDVDARNRAKEATLDRYTSEMDEMIHRDADESKEAIGHDTEFGRGIKQLLKDYATGVIPDAEAFAEERGRLLQQMHDSGNSPLIGEGKVRIDNLMALADQVKAMYEHQEDIDRALDGMKMYTGEARSNVRTEVQLAGAEKVIEWLNRRKFVGGLVGPVGVSVAASVALGFVKFGRASALRALGVTMVPGVLGGVYAGAREYGRVKQEWELHNREMAQGKRYEQGAKRRDEIEATRYEAVGAAELTAQLNELLQEGEAPTPEQVQSAYEAIAAAEARIRLSDKRGIDLVSYSDVLEVERERQQLDAARALAKVRLGHHLGDLPAQFRTDHGITDSQTVNQALEQYTAAVAELDADITAKDAAFRKLRRRRVAKAAAIGAAVSFTGGIIAQEAIAGLNPSYDGLIEHMAKGGAPSEDGRQTVLEGFFHGKTAEHITPSKTFERHPFGAYKDALKVPDNYNVIANPDGTVTIEAPNGDKVAENLELNKKGHLTKESIATLKAHNVQVIDKSVIDDSDTTKKTKHFSVKDYIKHHKDHITHVKRDFWYDNNTPAPNFDKNELGLDWGGEGHKGAGANGSVKMTVGGMTSGGSYHNGEHVSWREAAKDGDLKIAVSGSRGTQSDVFMIKVKPDGTVTIPEDHPARKYFTIDKHGQAHFKGGYVEVVEIRGEKGGTTHIAPLATVVGENSVTKVKDTVEVPVKKNVPRFKLIPPPIETQGREVLGFGGPAFVGRRPLEKLANRRRDGEYGYGYHGSYGESGRGVPEEVMQAMVRERSPSIAENPNAELNPREELDRYRDVIGDRRGKEALKAIEDVIERTPELANMRQDTETIVTIPVGAAFESDNIFNTLSLYAQQDQESLDKTLIIVNVNQLDTVSSNPELNAKAEKTRREVERARQRFPNLRIAVLDNTYSKADADRTGGVIGYAAQDLVDASLLAILHNMRSGNLTDDSRIVIQRHDADMLGMHRHHLARLQAAAKRYGDTDMFQGATRLDVRLAERFPGWGIVDDIYNITTTYYSTHGSMHTGGANFAVRAESLAAVGGLGDLRTARFGSGAGSDDSNVGIRISSARGASPRLEGYGSSPSMGSGVIIPQIEDRKILRHVGGMNIDTNAERFLPIYLRGEHWHTAWTPGVGSFNRGEGEYGPRNQEKRQSNRREGFGIGNKLGFTRLEQVMSLELSAMGDDMRARILSSFFREVPGAYRLEPRANGEVQFKLTKAGQAFVRSKMTRTLGRKSYAQKKIEGMYGDKAGRTPIGQQSPLVSPLK